MYIFKKFWVWFQEHEKYLSNELNDRISRNLVVTLLLLHDLVRSTSLKNIKQLEI